MTCRLRHRWDGWHFVVCEDPWNGGVQTLYDTVWRMCRQCGTDEEHESATATTSMVTVRLRRWRARMP